MNSCTCTAPVNIAVIKYWGKRDEVLVLPVNSSVSITLAQEQLCAKTTVQASKDFTCDRLWLNGREESVDTPRIQNLLKEIKNRARIQGNHENSDLLDWKIHICSENNFPTAAGLASSAAGYGCLAFTLAKLYRVEGDISDIARRGSGSACRSILGGFVLWAKGEKEDGSDSLAKQIAMETHWSELRALILVVSANKKPIGSSQGMQATLRTSQLMAERISRVPEQVERITEAIHNKDFHTFAEITMQDSNQLHAVCLDTYPPISYLTDVSRQIIQLVHAYNTYHGENRVAYTFDAGPNACLYLLESDVPRVVSLVKRFFPPDGSVQNFLTGLQIEETEEVEQGCLSAIPLGLEQGAIKYIIYTKPGPGPQVCLQENESLLSNEGLPKVLGTDKRKFDCVS